MAHDDGLRHTSPKPFCSGQSRHSAASSRGQITRRHRPRVAPANQGSRKGLFVDKGIRLALGEFLAGDAADEPCVAGQFVNERSNRSRPILGRNRSMAAGRCGACVPHPDPSRLGYSTQISVIGDKIQRTRRLYVLDTNLIPRAGSAPMAF
jgi:hypothetical protein